MPTLDLPATFLSSLQSARFSVFLTVDGQMEATSHPGPKHTWLFSNGLQSTCGAYSVLISPAKGKFLSVDDENSKLLIVDKEYRWSVVPTETKNQVYIVAGKWFLGCDKHADNAPFTVMLKTGGSGQGRRWNLVPTATTSEIAVTEPTFTCPYPKCKQSGLTEDQLVEHCPRFHYNENVKMICPICTHYKTGDYEKPQGVKGWGYSVHLHNSHGPVGRKNRQMSQEEKRRQHIAETAPTYGFALVIVQHPKTKKFLIVEEACDQGYWLPGGRVDPGETFQEAAIRETIEEAGCKVKLTGIIRMEYSPYADGGARQRIIFYGVPEDENAPVKTIPDYESVRAVWVSFPEMQQMVKSKKMKLRGPEPMQFYSYIHNGGTVYPMSLLTLEGAQ